MSDPVIVVFYNSSGLPLSGLSPVFTSPGFYKTLVGVSVSAPAVSDNGDGSYSFTPSATDLSTGIRYVLDGGATATPRFYDGEIDSAAAAAAATSVSIVGVNVFGVTFTNLFTRHLPQYPTPTSDNNPSAATISEIIDECAATLEGKLAQESIVATSLTVTNAGAYLWCRQTLRLLAIVQCWPVLTGQDPAILVAARSEVAGRWAELSANGYLALGSGVSAPSIRPDGPTHFIDSLGIDISDTASLASTVTARLRRDDEL